MEGFPFNSYEEFRNAYDSGLIRVKMNQSAAYKIAINFSKWPVLLSLFYFLIGIVFIITYCIITGDYYPLISIPFILLTALVSRITKLILWAAIIFTILCIVFNWYFGFIMISAAIILVYIGEAIWLGYVLYKAYFVVIYNEEWLKAAWNNYAMILVDSQGNIYRPPFSAEKG